MPLFLDSNVIVGYYLCQTHRLGNPAENVFTGNEECWWSTRVEKECFGDRGNGGVCGKEGYTARKELRKLIAEFERGTYTTNSLKKY